MNKPITPPVLSSQSFGTLKLHEKSQPLENGQTVTKETPKGVNKPVIAAAVTVALALVALAYSYFTRSSQPVCLVPPSTSSAFLKQSTADFINDYREVVPDRNFKFYFKTPQGDFRSTNPHLYQHLGYRMQDSVRTATASAARLAQPVVSPIAEYGISFGQSYGKGVVSSASLIANKISSAASLTVNGISSVFQENLSTFSQQSLGLGSVLTITGKLLSTRGFNRLGKSLYITSILPAILAAGQAAFSEPPQQKGYFPFNLFQ